MLVSGGWSHKWTNEYRAPGWFWFQERISYRSVVELILPKFVEIVAGISETQESQEAWKKIWKKTTQKQRHKTDKNAAKTSRLVPRPRRQKRRRLRVLHERLQHLPEPDKPSLALKKHALSTRYVVKIITLTKRLKHCLEKNGWAFSFCRVFSWNPRPWSASQPMPKVRTITIFHSISRTDQLIAVAPCWLVDFAFSRSNFPPKCLDFEVYKFVSSMLYEPLVFSLPSSSAHGIRATFFL